MLYVRRGSHFIPPRGIPYLLRQANHLSNVTQRSSRANFYENEREASGLLRFNKF